MNPLKTIAVCLTLTVTFLGAQASAANLGCRLSDHSAIYQADSSSSKLILTAQKALDWEELLDDFAGAFENVDDSDIDKILQAIDDNGIVGFAKGDQIIIESGATTTISLSGSQSATITDLSAGLFSILSPAIQSAVYPASCQQAIQTIGCRPMAGSKAYMAQSVGDDIVISISKNLDIADVIEDIAAQTGLDQIEDSDLDAILQAVDSSGISQLQAKDQIVIQPGTQILFKGQTALQISGLTAGLFDILKNAITLAVEPCVEVLGCRLNPAGTPIYQAQKVNDSLQMVSKVNSSILDLIEELAAGGSIDQIADEDLGAIVEGIDTNGITNVSVGDTITVAPGSSLSFAGSHTAQVSGLSAGFFQQISDIIIPSLTAGSCQ